MMKRNLVDLLSTGVVLVAVLGGGTTFASNNDKDRSEVQAFLGAAQDITAAIRAAEAASGGKAVAAEFDEDNGKGLYEIDTIAGGRQIAVEIDAASGTLIKTRDEGDVANADADDITDPARLGAPLAELAAIAQKNGSGKVMSIGVEHEDSQAGLIAVELAKTDGSTQEFTMASDGTLSKMHGDDDDDDHDGNDRDERDDDDKD